MKKLMFVIMCVVVTAASAAKRDPEYLAARRHGALTRFQVHVVDDSGMNVANADVKVFLGMNFRPRGHWVAGKTNEAGLLAVNGKTCGDEINISVSKEGYYKSQKKMSFARIGAEHEVSDGRWLPFDAILKMRLRPISHPIPLREVGFGEGKPVPTTNIWIGVDMARNDFVFPYGNGTETDFKVLVEWDGHPPIDCKHCALDIRFDSPDAGGYYEKKVMESSYPYAYEAQTNNSYALTSVGVVEGGRFSSEEFLRFRDDSVIVTRTRCVRGDNGELKSAHYGYIRVVGISASWEGMPTIRLAGVFNPVPNDTNLEPKQPSIR